MRPETRQPSRAIRPTTSTSRRPLDDLDALVESRLVVAVFDRDGRLGDHRAGVDPVVDQVDGAAGDLHAVGERVAHGVGAGEGREERRVGVDHREPRQHGRAEDLHEPGRHHQVGFVVADLLGQGGIPRLAGRMITYPLGESGQTGAFGAGQPLDRRTVGPDGHDGRAIGRICRRVEQGL